ncbi:bifunctional molybdenum cofactor biosynthesis protein MoaC/MoaB [bacterium SCSIO 12741]|nr:bifunctional molybdenum cofactor biosynthesis protein MoaC/MoaB [bacterium SCSIO 12741]
MVDITHKNNTLRQAVAEATVKVSDPATIAAIENRQVPKGDVFEMAKAAGLLAVKRTWEMLPDCHPLPVEYTGIRYEIQDLSIRIEMEVKTIYKTGVEVEAMHGASVVALTMYDMLKPLDKGVEIQNIRLLRKKGGKTDYKNRFQEGELKAAVIVCSDSISAGQKEDKAGKVICQKLEAANVQVDHYEVIPDEFDQIQSQVNHWYEKADLLIFTGGTGLSPRDNTPEAVKPLLDQEIPGIMETARNYGQNRMPYSMLSRGIAGLKGNCMVLTLPGSTNGAKESMDALFPALLHSFHIMGGGKH